MTSYSPIDDNTRFITAMIYGLRFSRDIALYFDISIYMLRLLYFGISRVVRDDDDVITTDAFIYRYAICRIDFIFDARLFAASAMMH